MPSILLLLFVIIHVIHPHYKHAVPIDDRHVRVADFSVCDQFPVKAVYFGSGRDYRSRPAVFELYHTRRFEFRRGGFGGNLAARDYAGRFLRLKVRGEGVQHRAVPVDGDFVRAVVAVFVFPAGCRRYAARASVRGQVGGSLAVVRAANQVARPRGVGRLGAAVVRVLGRVVAQSRHKRAPVVIPAEDVAQYLVPRLAVFLVFGQRVGGIQRVRGRRQSPVRAPVVACRSKDAAITVVAGVGHEPVRVREEFRPQRVYEALPLASPARRQVRQAGHRADVRPAEVGTQVRSAGAALKIVEVSVLAGSLPHLDGGPKPFVRVAGLSVRTGRKRGLVGADG